MGWNKSTSRLFNVKIFNFVAAFCFCKCKVIDFLKVFKIISSNHTLICPHRPPESFVRQRSTTQATPDDIASDRPFI